MKKLGNSDKKIATASPNEGGVHHSSFISKPSLNPGSGPGLAPTQMLRESGNQVMNSGTHLNTIDQHNLQKASRANMVSSNSNEQQQTVMAVMGQPHFNTSQYPSQTQYPPGSSPA